MVLVHSKVLCRLAFSKYNFHTAIRITFTLTGTHHWITAEKKHKTQNRYIVRVAKRVSLKFVCNFDYCHIKVYQKDRQRVTATGREVKSGENFPKCKIFKQ